MKTLNFFVSVLVIGFALLINPVNAQTIQRDLNATFDEAIYIPCADVFVLGTATFHFTYHLDNMTGKIDRMHWNILHLNMWDAESGEKILLMDTGSDNQGAATFNWFNNMNGSNGLVDEYDVQDGWLDDVMPETLPDEGSYVEMCWKFKVGGEMYSMSFMTQLHKNAKGEVTVDNAKTVVKCL